jgi:glycosyltransferase involved in cell wall biosynthesis
MRIVICDYGGHAFPVELSRRLAARGHAVLHLYFTAFEAPKGRVAATADDPPGFAVEGIDIGRPIDKRRFFQRPFLEAAFGDRAAAHAVAFRPDVVVGCCMPLDAQRRFQVACRARRIPFVFWLQDIYSHAIYHYVGQKLGLPGQLIGRYYAKLEGRLLRRSDAVVAISPSFLPALDRWGVRRGVVSVIPNWPSLSDIRPMPKNNPWARRHGLGDKLVALYSGTLGLKHAPGLLWDLACSAEDLGVHLVVVSEGAGARWLAERQQETGIAHLTVLPFQPIEAFSEVLGAADVALAMIDAEAGGFSVPSKVLSYLAGGKPIVAAMPGDNDAAEMIRSSDCGCVVPPGDSVAFRAAVKALARDDGRRAVCADNARRFAEAHFDIEEIASRFEQVFAVARQGRGAVPQDDQRHLAAPGAPAEP